MEQEATRSALGDGFDRVRRSLVGLPDVTATKTSTIRVQSKILERTQTFSVETFRQREEGDTIFIEYVSAEGSLRLAIPPEVAELIARQRDALTVKVRKKIAKAQADDRKARGIEPGFKKRKGVA